MPSLNELINGPRQLSLFSKKCKACGQKSKYRKYLLGKYEPYDHCDGSPCYTCGVACCNHPDIEKFIEDVDGLDFATVKAQKITSPLLPLFIPGIRSNGFSQNKIHLPWIALSVSEIWKSQYRKNNGMLKVPESSLKENLKESFSLSPNTGIILLSYGPDKLIEKIWREEENNYFPKIKQMGFKMATAFNFSLFWGECRLGQRINLKKSLKTFELYQKYNIPSTPHIYWLNEFDLEEWVKWLSVNPSIKMVALNLQMLAHQNDFVLDGIKYLIKHTNNQISLFLSGRFDPSLDFFREVSKITKNVVISNLNIYMKAQANRQLVKKTDKFQFIYNGKLSKSKIFQQGVQLYEKELRKIFGKRKKE